MLNLFNKLMELFPTITSAVGRLFTSFKVYLALVIIIIISVLSWTTIHYHKSLQDKETEYKVLLSKNDELVAMIKSDAEAVDAYAATSRAREEAAKKALADAQKKVEFYSTSAQDILLATPVDTSLCKSAEFLFNGYIEGKPK